MTKVGCLLCLGEPKLLNRKSETYKNCTFLQIKEQKGGQVQNSTLLKGWRYIWVISPLLNTTVEK